jgi:hypothetical protein
VTLIRSYADGRTDDEAFEAAIGLDVAALNDAWLADLGAVVPTRHGPRPAPPGPQPAAWGEGGPGPQPGVTAGPAASGPPAAPGPTTGSASTGLPIAVFALLAVVAVGGVMIASRARRGPGEPADAVPLLADTGPPPADPPPPGPPAS